MSITVKFFANLRERYGLNEESIDYREGISIPEIWSTLTNSQEMPATLMVAVNMAYSKKDVALADGDEVAFFPPVSGG